MNLKCDICGGNVIIHPDTKTATCEACENVSEIDSATAGKYKSLITLADTKMKINTLNSCKEALDILEDIPFVEHVSDKIVQCNNRINELQNNETDKPNDNDSENKKIGVFVIISILVLLLLCITGLFHIGYRIVTGAGSSNTVYISIIISVVSLVLILLNKKK